MIKGIKENIARMKKFFEFVQFLGDVVEMLNELKKELATAYKVEGAEFFDDIETKIHKSPNLIDNELLPVLGKIRKYLGV